MSHFILVDDGTLDTVLQCRECGEQLRFTYDREEDFEEWMEWCFTEAEEQHECPDGAWDEYTPGG